VTDPVDLLAIVPEGDPADPPTYRSRGVRVGPLIGASALGGTVYELDPGESVCPYHYENAEEEWLLVLSGAPTLRDPEGEHELVRGDVVCFPIGPDGAHKVTNPTEAPVRVLILSTRPKPEVSVCVYPDSEKVGIWPPGGIFRFADKVGYWNGEVDGAD
jgi:uncharacterized cupin superfamily protein